ncbi:carboxypeptidase-like regulatory domain-containing protein [Adhaeribacter terreus]|uniref:Carboxypeptidase-like regulatory domain-containing protein n=1 Tax=Adhaeribacter terreus TaxID=529703 RepID=A0ABW0EAK1_9BACT
MRQILLCFLLFLCFSLPFSGSAQIAASHGEQTVKIPAKTYTVEEILKELEAQTKIPFSYSNEALPLQKKITLTGREQTLEAVLHTVFKGTSIAWLYRSDQILLFDKKPAAQNDTKTGAKSGKFTISGYVREAGSSEPLIGVTVYAPQFKAGISSNNYGFYSLTLPADSVVLQFSYVGYKSQIQKINLNEDQTLHAFLQPEAALQEVEIVAEKEIRSTQTTQTSQVNIPVEMVKDMPALFGEKDVIKTVQMMPGVQKGGEASTGLYVRGGGPDQNLIVLDDATVYNANHALGYLSLFNGDALKSIDLTKGGFPARYGGRLSSVLEMNMKEGNREEFAGEAGIGLISSRMVVEGPLKKDKASFLISARRTYWDLLLNSFLQEGTGFGYFFYDANAKINYDLGPKDKLYLSGYFGRDKFYVHLKDSENKDQFNTAWGNGTATLRWNHLLSDRLFANTSFIFSQYRFGIDYDFATPDVQTNFQYISGIRDLSLKTDLDYYLSTSHFLKIGFISTHHYFTPNSVRASDSNTNLNFEKHENISNLESAVYLEDHFTVTPKILLNSGLRLSHFFSEGKHYFNPEPRFSAAYRFTPNATLKTSYAAMNQYVHLLSSIGTGQSIDLWLPATNKVKPQASHQVALGVAQDLFKRKILLEVEGYYKKMDRIITYRDGASFFTLNDPTAKEGMDWESNVVSGQGWSYGLEFLLQKKTGNLTGWLGYTLSRTQHQFDSINGGRKFDARYDRRHDVSVILAYDVSEKIKLSANWIYGTGNAITLPLAEYSVPYHNPDSEAITPEELLGGNTIIGEYGERNNYRMPAYHRLDVGIQFRKELSWAERTWDLSVYNLYNRKNPFFYTLATKNGKRELRQTAIFGFIPSFSYNLKF